MKRPSILLVVTTMVLMTATAHAAQPAIVVTSSSAPVGRAIEIAITGSDMYGWQLTLTYGSGSLVMTDCNAPDFGGCTFELEEGSSRTAGANAPAGTFELSTFEAKCLAVGPVEMAIAGGLMPVNGSSDVYGPRHFDLDCTAMGDADCTEIVSSLDALAILQWGAGLGPPLPCALSADVDLSDRVDPIDALFVLQFVSGLIPYLPFP